MYRVRMRPKKIEPSTRGEKYRRALHVRYDEDTDQIVYLHATKGWRSRQATPHLFYGMRVS